jgi:hypothetical protein
MQPADARTRHRVPLIVLRRNRLGPPVHACPCCVARDRAKVQLEKARHRRASAYRPMKIDFATIA